MASLVDPGGGETSTWLSSEVPMSRRKNSGRPDISEALSTSVASGDDLSSVGTHERDVFIAELRETARMQTDLHRAEQRLGLQIGAIGKRIAAANKGMEPNRLLPQPDGEVQQSPDTHESRDLAVLPLETARVVIHDARVPLRKRMEQIARQLPVWLWVEQVRGFGAFGLAQIIGECGDLDNYANPAKVWKRMGLAVINGERQRRVTGEAALLHGYVPYRRAIMWNIGQSLVKLNQDGSYKRCYDERKAYELARDPEGAPIKHHKRAQRYMEKRLLKHLWQAWRLTLA